MVLKKEFFRFIVNRPYDAATWGLSLLGVMGCFLLGAGLEVVPLPPKAQPQVDAKVKFFLSSIQRNLGLALNPNHFLAFVGACQIVGTAALHGLLGRILDKLANVCFCILCVLVVPTHIYVKEAGDPNGAIPLGFLAVALVRLCLPLFMQKAPSKRIAGDKDSKKRK
eukprot:TRINITY_DN58610_c0_g1_i1.p1 TRINITY_DN58610_c0_g1~~TRINITY_DN58610_c0_g1_i1.p1  ORF type:complete len:179 (-),score=24.63 TRINITY_DN58610_c0_g1_i1:237-737(-)